VIKKLRTKVLSFLSLFSLFLNLANPFVLAATYFVPSPAFADETEVVTPPTGDPAPAEESPAITEPPIEPSVDPSPTPSPEPSVDLSTTPEPSPEPSIAPSPAPTESSAPAATLTATVTEEPVPPPADEFDLETTEPTSAILATDKPDYTPSEVVAVSGDGYSPSTQYRIVISSQDDPAITHEDSVTTDADGHLSYSYQLDGQFRPNYLVQLFDLGGALVASVTFTDTQPDKMNICHRDNGVPAWKAIQIAPSAWPAHQSHGDFIYSGNTDDGVPYNPNGEADAWCVANNPNPAPTEEIIEVHHSDLANDFSKVMSDPTKWFFYNDETDVIDNSLGLFVSGPNTAPRGDGSIEISVSGSQRRNIATYQFSGTPLANIQTLAFSTYNPSVGNVGSTSRAGYLNFNVTFDGNDTWQKRLAFVPSVNSTVVQDAWQEWDAIDNGNALWSWSGFAGNGNMWPDNNASEYRTWSDILTAFPNIAIRTTDSWLGVRVGEPYVDGYTENIDLFKFEVGFHTKIWDFEPEAVCAPGPSWANSVVESHQGTKKDDSPITDPIRVDPNKTLGAAVPGDDSDFFSLGKDGTITVAFTHSVQDVTGADLSFHETTWGNRVSYGEEKAKVEVAQNPAGPWLEIGTASNQDNDGEPGETLLDFGGHSWSWIKYVRLTDTTDYSIFGGDADGYDLDAVDATYELCEDLSEEPMVPTYSCDNTVYAVNNNQGLYWVETTNGVLHNLDTLSLYGSSASADDPFQPRTYYINRTGDQLGYYDHDLNLSVPIGSTGVASNSEPFTKLTFDRYGKLLGMTDKHKLYEINPSNASSTYLGTISGVATGGDIVFDELGDLYLIGTDGNFFRIDLPSLNKTPIKNTGISPVTGLAYVSGQFYFSSTNAVYRMEHDGSGQVKLSDNQPAINDLSSCSIGETPTTGSVTGYKYFDRDASGHWDDEQGEPGLAGWTIGAWTEFNAEATPVASTTTAADGSYSLTDLVPGDYYICEEAMDGGDYPWQQSYPDYNTSNVQADGRYCHTITVTAGSTLTHIDFGNYRQGAIAGMKWNDLNGDGVYDGQSDPAEPMLNGWTIFIDNDHNGQIDTEEYFTQTATDSHSNPGQYLSNNLKPGTYTVCEQMQSGWVNTYPAASTCQEVTVISGQTTYDVNFGNQFLPFCGNGVKEGEEACDGTNGVDANSFCTTNCQLVPVYHGGNTCSNGMVKGELRYSGDISATDPDGETLDLTPHQEYLFEASNTFIPTSAAGYLSDAGFTWINSILQPNYGIYGTDPDLGAHALLGNLGLGVGIIDWGAVNVTTHTYPFAYTPTIGTQQFVIGDRYSDWFNTPWQNQSGMNDNQGSLHLDVYDCVAPPVTIQATKIVCDSETDLPNMSGGANISATTAQDFLSTHPNCRVEPDWMFQWGFADKSGTQGVDKLTGTHTGIADGTPSSCSANCGTNTNTGTAYNNWKTFGATTSDGIATAVITDLEGAPGIWVREVLKEGYIPFTYPPQASPGSDISAELYCYQDVEKYDNYDQIANPQAGATYHCVAFNARATSTVKVCKEDSDHNPLRGWKVGLSVPTGFESLIPVSDGAGLTTPLGDGAYVVYASGTYRYGNTAMIADAGYSFRPLGIPHGTGGWVNGDDLSHPGALELSLSGGNITDSNINWGGYNPNHQYSAYLTGWGANDLTLSIWDDYYGDNLNNDSFRAQIDKSYEAHMVGEDGCATFENVPYGDYNVFEVPQSGWYYQSTTVGSDTITTYPAQVTVGTQVPEITLTNAPSTGSVYGAKYTDLNQNHTRDAGEDGLGGWDIYLRDPSAPATPLATTTTASDGSYRFDNIPAGEYLVCEDTSFVSDNWVQREPTSGTLYDGWHCYNLSLPPGAEYGGYNFGNFQYGSAFVNKYEDLDGVLGRSGDETWIGDPTFTFRLYYHDVSGWNLVREEDTNGDGLASFTGNLTQLGNYSICEVQKEGWEEMRSLFNSANNLSGQTDEYPVCEGITMSSSGYKVAVETGNIHNGSLTVVKYEDLDGDGVRDDGEGLLEGWTMNVTDGDTYNDSQVTDQNGEAAFPGLVSGNYALEETEQEGYRQTGFSCDRVPQEPEQVLERLVSVVSVSKYNLRIDAGETTTCYVGNQPLSELTVQKFNDADGAVGPGSKVKFTLVLKLLGGKLFGVKLTDLFPHGFSYVEGSWTSSLGGVPEPSYHSPGVWELGDMNPGDEVTLTYLAEVGSDVDSGTYKDLAWATGDSSGWGTVYAEGVDSTYTSGGFVGSEVEVNKDSRGGIGVDVEGEVLGASTSTVGELPATGADTKWLVLAIAMLTLGLSLLLGARKSSKKLAVALFFGLGLMVPGAIHAYDDPSLAVVLEEPKSPTSDQGLTLAYTVLDVEGRAVTVRCYKKGPTDGSYSQFDSATLAEGGNNGVCETGSSVLNSRGDYSFYVTANAGDGEEASNAVSLFYETEAPGTPGNYSKEHPSACRYIIKFKTADDSDRSRHVEIYRSQEVSYTADAGTLTGGLSVESNHEYEYIHDFAGDCDKTWYYAVRAFNDVGQGSGIVGDQVTVITKSGTTEVLTAGAVPVSSLPGGTVLGQESGQTGGSVQTEDSGEVLGESIPSEEPVSTSTLKDSVQSAVTGPYRWYLLIGILASLGIVFYVVRLFVKP